MLPYKKILCPTDFSEPSFEALKAANELAMHFKSVLYVVHVVPPIPLTPSMTFIPPMTADSARKAEDYKTELVRHSEEALKEVLKDKTGERVGLYPIVKYGPVDDKIIDLIRDKSVDLLIMGTHGQTGVKRLLFGSTAEKVVRRATCPVMVVPVRDEEEE